MGRGARRQVAHAHVPGFRGGGRRRPRGLRAGGDRAAQVGQGVPHGVHRRRIRPAGEHDDQHLRAEGLRHHRVQDRGLHREQQQDRLQFLPPPEHPAHHVLAGPRRVFHRCRRGGRGGQDQGEARQAFRPRPAHARIRRAHPRRVLRLLEPRPHVRLPADRVRAPLGRIRRHAQGGHPLLAYRPVAPDAGRALRGRRLHPLPEPPRRGRRHGRAPRCRRGEAPVHREDELYARRRDRAGHRRRELLGIARGADVGLEAPPVDAGGHAAGDRQLRPHPQRLRERPHRLRADLLARVQRGRYERQGPAEVPRPPEDQPRRARRLR